MIALRKPHLYLRDMSTAEMVTKREVGEDEKHFVLPTTFIYHSKFPLVKIDIQTELNGKKTG